MDKTEIDLQKLVFFTQGNTFTGSRTKDAARGVLLRYRAAPDKDAGEIVAHCWKQDVCFELAKDPIEARFPMTEEGLSQAQQWFAEQYESL